MNRRDQCVDSSGGTKGRLTDPGYVTMADESAATRDGQAESTSPKRPWLVTTLTVVLVVAVIEAAAVFVTFKFFGARPGASYGDSRHVLEGDGAADQEPEFVEVALLKKFKVPNDKSGLTVIYDFDVSVVVPAARRQAVEELVKARDGAIRDRVMQTIRQASQRVLGEDDFGTLRLLLKRALSEVLGDDEIVARVLIPRCVPTRTD